MVKNKFTITITDINGSRHFYLNQIIKKIVFYTIAFIVLFLVFSGFYIKYLDSKLSDISEKREELLKKSKELELSNSQMQKSIEEKTQQYAAIEDKIASLEEDTSKYATDFTKLQEIMDEKTKLENELQVKYERWEYLNNLAEEIANWSNN